VSELLGGGGGRVVALAELGPDAPPLVLMTSHGSVKRLLTDDRPVRGDRWDIVSLRDGDEVVAAAHSSREDDRIVVVTSNAQLLHFPAEAVRIQGRGAQGMAGIRLGEGARVRGAAVVAEADVSSAV